MKFAESRGINDQEELREVYSATTRQDWGDLFLELTHVLYLMFNLDQEASLESVLSAALALKHASKLTKPAHFVQPDATSLVQAVKAEQDGSEISCVLDRDSQKG